MPDLSLLSMTTRMVFRVRWSSVKEGRSVFVVTSKFLYWRQLDGQRLFTMLIKSYPWAAGISHLFARISPNSKDCMEKVKVHIEWILHNRLDLTLAWSLVLRRWVGASEACKTKSIGRSSWKHRIWNTR